MFRSYLDEDSNYHKLDSLNVYSSLERLDRQFDSAWNDAHFLNITFDPKKIKTIVFAGMGASVLAGKMIHALSPFFLKIPFEVCSNYRLPMYVNRKTLVILSSYSGNTAEIISCAQDAKKRGAKIICMTSGGQLEKFAKSESLPLILFQNQNTSSIPRMGLFYSIGATLSIIRRLSDHKQDLDQKQLSLIITRSLDHIRREIELEKNPAKNLAQKMKHTSIFFISSNHLVGVGESIKNYVNESAKSFSYHLAIPDLNHHFLDGLSFPLSYKNDTNFILINSNIYPSAIQKRVELTKDILLKQKYSVTVIKPESTSPVGQILESMVFFTFFSYYLSIVNKVDPGTNPWVDYFKNHI